MTKVQTVKTIKPGKPPKKTGTAKLAQAKKLRKLIEPPSPGIHKDIPSEIYHQFDAANFSTLKEFCRSGAHGAAYLNQEHKPPTDAMLFGTALHTAVLEPKDYAKRAMPCEDIGPKSEVKHRNRQEEYPNNIILREGWYDQIEAMRFNIQSHKAANNLLYETEGDSELTIIWSIDRKIGDKVITIPCKARVDRFVPKFIPVPGTGDVPCIVDVKTCQNADAHAFEKVIADRMYHMQAAWYLTGMIACGLMKDFHEYSSIIIACEKKPPYIVATYPITAAALDQGMTHCVKALVAYTKYRMLGHAPMPTDSLIPLGIPNWAMTPENETEGS